jgi:predicted aspartyl protease
MRATLVLLLLAIPASFPDAVALEREGSTRFEQGGQGGIILPVRLNGRGPFRFLLDTGSTHTAVSPATAAEIGAPVVAKTAIGSAAGSREALVVRIDVTEVGPITVPDLLASVVEPGGIGDIDGVIGHDALAPLRYTIDFRQGRLLWWPIEGSIARGSSLELQSRHGRFLLSLPQRRSVLRLVPDTGAASLLLFDPDRTLPVTHLPDRATLTTTTAEAEVRLARLRVLQIGNVTLRDVPAVVAGRDQSEPAEVDGLLPLYFFDRVTFDGPHRCLIVEKTQANGSLMFF